MKKEYNKLVRDNIIEIIEQQNKKCEYRILDEEEYLSALLKKFKEEESEFFESLAIEELADIEEVIHALILAKGYTLEEFEEMRAKKAKTREAFHKKIFLISVQD